MNKTKTKIGMILSMILTLCIICLLIPIFSANAADANTVVEMQTGAFVKAPTGSNDDAGIKFTAIVNESSYNTIAQGSQDPITFGMEITANGHTEDYPNNESVYFQEGKFEYSVSILYNTVQLKHDLALSDKFNPDYNNYTNDEDRIANFNEDLLESYMKQAYGKELTAKAYYVIGSGEKVYVDNPQTRSMWGVATAAYNSGKAEYFPDDTFILSGKYFDGETVNESELYVQKDGEIVGDYTATATSKVYIDAENVSATITDGKVKISTTALDDVTLKDNVKISLVDSANKKLVVSNPKYVTAVSLTESIYDATENKIYYKNSAGEKQIVGDSSTDIKYVDSDNNAYALKGNVTYLYLNSTTVDQYGLADTTVSNLRRITPKIISENMTINMPYDATTCEYAGVKVEIDNGTDYYLFNDTVFATAVIDTGLELKEIFNKPDNDDGARVYDSTWIGVYGNITKGVYMLADDIDAAATGFDFDNSYFNFFEGVFDGRGHNITNLDVSITKDEYLAGHGGNGLFSAISNFSIVQNVGFIDVKADYGSVFQGNLADARFTGNAHYDPAKKVPGGNTTYDTKAYRLQLGLAEDVATTTLLQSTTRVGASSTNRLSAWSNVFVEVAPTTKRFMGVISRNLPKRYLQADTSLVELRGTLHAFNMVIEYQPTTLYDSSADAYDGALPINYEYSTDGQFGVLFGGIYSIENTENTSSHIFDAPAGYAGGTYAKNAGLSVKAGVRIYYDANGTSGRNTDDTGTLGALNFFNTRKSDVTADLKANAKIYVISPVGLASSNKGKVLGTNEVNGGTAYQFVAMANESDWTAGKYDNKARLERYDSYSALEAMNYSFEQINSYYYSETQPVYWNVTNGTLVWKNLVG